jgi:2-hydroxychromene-2-carboxylate isomerase
MDLAVAVGEGDHRQGPDEAPVTLVQYGDYECPYTRRSTNVVRAIQQRLGDRLRFVFRNFPLTEIHPHALHAALAAEAAGSQGRFWPMHDAIFQHQHSLEDADLIHIAEELVPELARFTSDLEEQRHLARIEEDVEGGIRSGVVGTPTFFINAVRYEGSWDLEQLLAALQAEVGRSLPPMQRGRDVAMQRSRKQVVDVLRKAGFPELAELALEFLPDPVDLEDAVKFLEPHGVTRDVLISRLGGSP